MWTTHVVYLLLLALTTWIAYRVGVAVESGRCDDALDEVHEAHAATVKRMAEQEAQLELVRVGRSRWRASAVEAQTSLERERELSSRLMERLLPPLGDDSTEPLTVSEADRLAVQERRKALEREAAMEYDGREPVPITDDDAEPPPRLRHEEDEEDATAA